MKVYLARHSEAAPGDIDSERPLTEKGCQDVDLIVNFLAPRKLQVDYFFHSGKLRAQQTAERLAKAITCPKAVAARSGLNPTDLVSPIANEINRFDHNLALVGHMPFMGKLVSKLLSGHETHDFLLFQTATVVCLERMADGGWVFRWILSPELFA